MDTTRALLMAVKESAAKIDERFDGYRARLVKALVHVLEAQSTHGSVGPRRQAVETAIAAVAEQLEANRVKGEHPL